MTDDAKKNEIAIQVGNVLKEARDSLAELETELHVSGYHIYSAGVANLRNHLEKSEHTFVDELMVNT